MQYLEQTLPCTQAFRRGKVGAEGSWGVQNEMVNSKARRSGGEITQHLDHQRQCLASATVCDCETSRGCLRGATDVFAFSFSCRRLQIEQRQL